MAKKEDSIIPRPGSEESEATYTLTLDQVDEISLKIEEALAMAEVLEAAAMAAPFEIKNLYTFASMLQEKVEAVHKSFDQATSKDEKAA